MTGKPRLPDGACRTPSLPSAASMPMDWLAMVRVYHLKYSITNQLILLLINLRPARLLFAGTTAGRLR